MCGACAAGLAAGESSLMPASARFPPSKEGVTMAISGDKISSMQQEQFNATMRLANVAMSNAQKMISMQAAAAKAMFEDSMAQAQLMTQAGNDPQAQIQARTAAMQQSAQRLMDMSRE